MLDFNHLITRPGVDVQVFTLPSTVTNTQWHMWNRPRGVSVSTILCIGGGGAGGSGFTRTAGSAGGGGGGGGSAPHSTFTFLLDLLPSSLFVQVGRGGDAVSGITGIISQVCIVPNNTAALNVLAISGVASGGGGGNGSAGASGTGGGAGTSADISSSPLAGLSIFNNSPGQSGAAGGAQTGAAGGNTTIAITGGLCQGGSGGGGTTSADFAGGGITAIANSLLSDIRQPLAPAGSNPGAHGVTLWKPFFCFAGLGGGSSNTGVGGRGGDGAYGSGGGGGGAGTTGGLGGVGGNGLVIIVSY